MKKPIYILLGLIFIIGCKSIGNSTYKQNSKKVNQEVVIDIRDNREYGIVRIGEFKWFSENLKFQSPKSKCYKNKKINCEKYGRIYPSSELETVCPKGWRVPNVKDWEYLKEQFKNDTIYALLDTVNWSNRVNHTNKSKLSIQSTGYQMEKRLFVGEGSSTSFWLNQFNKYDEYFHVHIYGGNGISFEKSGLTTNEVFHAHPIENIENRRFAIRCLCEN